MAKTGRPRVVIDQKQFEKLCALQCTLPEICSFFSCGEETIRRWCKRTYKATFESISTQKRQTGLISLRRAIWQKAVIKQDTALLIFMAKNHLGMSDSPKSSSEDDITLDKARDILDGVDSVI